MQRIALTILEMHYKDIHAGCLQLPVYRDGGSYSHMITTREHVPFSGPDFYREIDIPDGEYIGAPLVTGVCEYRLEEVPVTPVHSEPPQLPVRDYWKDQAQDLTAERNALRQQAETLKTAALVYAVVAMGGWSAFVSVLLWGA